MITQQNSNPLPLRHPKGDISDPTFYKWRSWFGGMEVSDAERLKALEDENQELKKLLAEQKFDVSALKELLGKSFGGPTANAMLWTLPRRAIHNARHVN